MSMRGGVCVYVCHEFNKLEKKKEQQQKNALTAEKIKITDRVKS